MFELECACASVRRASRAITATYNRELALSGLESTQFALLMVIHRSKEINQRGLAERLGMDSTSLTRALRPLVKKRLVAERIGRDRRVKFLSLTTTGARTLDDCLPAWRRTQDKLKQKMSRDGWDQLFKMMNHLASITEG